MAHGTNPGRPPGSVDHRKSGWVAKWRYREPTGVLRQRSRAFRTEEAAWQHLRQVDADRRFFTDEVAHQLRCREASAFLEGISEDLITNDFRLLATTLKELPDALREALRPPVDDKDLDQTIDRFATVCSRLQETLHRGLVAELLLADAAHEADARIGDALEGLMAESLRDCRDVAGPHVYCLWGDDPMKPLYVGKSMSVIPRVAAHLSVKERRDLIRRVSLIACTTEDRMGQTETRLIRRYQPPWNTLGVMPPMEV